MSALWAAVLVSAAAAVIALIRELLARGERDGKLDACVELLTRITADHEERLRLLEKQREHRGR